MLFAFLLATSTLQAQTGAQKFDISLKDGKYMQIHVCSEGIFRVRIQSKGEFVPGLMERYGILKTDWTPIEAKMKTVKGNEIIQTANYQLVIDKNAGVISVQDASGKTIIERIAPSNVGSGAGPELGKSLNAYFGPSKSGGGIVGDANYTGEKKANTEVGDFSKNSLLEFSLKNDERFYGGGSTSRKNIQHRGEALRMWATYQKTEIPMPFLMCSAGWGVFNNTTSKNYFDVGRFQKDKLFVYNTEGDMDFYLMLGNSMNEVIKSFVTITGKPYVLPKWAYGLAFGGNTVENIMDIMNDAVRFRDEKIPCDIFWIEPQWMAKNYDFSTSKNWDLKNFPAEPFWEAGNPKKYENKTLFISKLHGMGFKLGLWLCIDHDMSIAAEDQIATATGKPQSGQEHWFPHLTKFMDQGVDGFKLDPGRTLDEHPDRKYYNGSTDKEMHNLNQVLLPKQMNETFREHKGIRAFQHYCGGYAGSQHWGASTSGDNGGGKDALFDQLNLGLSGFVNTSADVLEGVDDNKAGMHLGFLLPWVQINSWYSLHHPWFMKPDEKETFRFYAQLRNSLFPYIYSAALEGHETGMPILRAMPLVFPDDRKVDNMIYQYMFGESLLVGVFSDSIYLPNGNWINFWTGEKFIGGKIVNCKVPENRGGQLFIKGGGIIPMQKQMNYIGEHPADTLIIKVYPEGKSSYTLLEDDGKSFDYEKGRMTKTRFECLQANDKTEFIIHPCEGTYSGVFVSRTYQLEIVWSAEPKQVLVNGSKTENWKYDRDGKIRLTVFHKNTSQNQVITIL
ncbi:MAG: DUF5110 domain-containing protein [Mariniphaga sp.]|nr:DUF5110 domain-containing protein [Mariniphaga sp.]